MIWSFHKNFVYKFVEFYRLKYYFEESLDWLCNLLTILFFLQEKAADYLGGRKS